jgi:UDP-N-acetylglucosamine 4,6-dehydratase
MVVDMYIQSTYDAVNSDLSGKTILITGGTGSLGKAIINYLKSNKIDCKIIVYSRDEGKQAIAFGSDKSIIRVIGDIRDAEKLLRTMKLHRPDYVIHTAALKRIDDMEYYPDECFNTNVQGSVNVANASFQSDVKKCILVSTDKACQPINVYGASKFMAERIFTNFDYNSSSTIFSSVRYGNVIASRGSFIPLWIDQINNGQRLKLTSDKCSRFLFTLQDAVITVLSALVQSDGGEVFVPKLKSYTMVDVINALKSMLNVDTVEFDIVGMRPGEKLHEDMLGQSELDFTHLSKFDSNLLAILPQYTNKTFNLFKYDGREFNSSLFLDNNEINLVELIRKGLNDAE